MDEKKQNKKLDKGDKKIIFWITIISIFIYIFTLTGSFGNYDKTNKLSDYFPGGSHQKSSYEQMLSLIHDKDVILDKSQADHAIPDVAYYRDNFYSFFPPGRAATAIPFYLLGSKINLSQVFAYMSVSLVALLTSILIYISMRQIFKANKQTALISTFIYSFTSISLLFASTFLQHAYSSFFFILIFYLVWRFKNSKNYLFLQTSIIWILYGISWFYDYSNMFILAPVIIYFYICSVSDPKTYPVHGTKLQMLFSSLLFFGLIIVMHLGYNQWAHGDMFRLSNTLPQYFGSNLEDLKLHSESIAKSKKAIKAFNINGTLNGLYTLFIDRTRSIFIYSPIFVLILFVPFIRNKKYHLEENILWLSIATTTLMYASFHSPGGGWSFGPRYLIPVLLSMSMLIGPWLKKSRNSKIISLGAIFLALFSLAQTLSGLLGLSQVPTGNETTWYGIKNLEYIYNGRSRNFMFNEFFSTYITLFDYYLILLGIISIIFIYIFYKKKWD